MIKYIFYFLITINLVSCTESNSSIQKSIDSNKTEISVLYAQHFKLQKTDAGIELQILNPDTKTIEKTYVINLSKERKIISMSTTLNGMVSILDVSSRLIGVSEIKYVYDSTILAKYNQGIISEFGNETNYSIEKVIESNATTILYSGFGDELPNHSKLEKLGLEIIPIYDWRETHPLGKAEWIKVIGIITGKEKEAIKYFNKTIEQYNEVKKLVSSSKNKPTVISGSLIGDFWYTPAGNSYMAQLFTDAGCEYIYNKTNGTGSIERTIESIIIDNATTEFWFNPGVNSKEKILAINPHVKHLNAFQNIYCYSNKMNKFWEMSAAQPHLVLSDYIHILHPEIKEITKFNFYQKIK